MTSHASSGKSVILFRADGSDQIGFGHLVRCSTLARQLCADGARVMLATRSMDQCPEWVSDLFPGEVHELRNDGAGCPDDGDPVPHASWLPTTQNEDASHVVELLSDLGLQTIDCLVVDHYGIDARWHRQLRPSCKRIMAIDDLADRALDVDILLDQNRSPDLAIVAYEHRLPDDSRLLAGPEWSLIREEFRDSRVQPRSLNEESPRVLVIMGGSDPDELTTQVLRSLTSIEHELEITAVIGRADQYEKLESLGSSMRHSLDVRVAERNMAALMAQADIAISAAGSTVWELCFMGIPMALAATEINQSAVIQQAEAAGAAVRLPDLGAHVIKAVLSTILNGRGRLGVMSRAGQQLVDGEGARRASEVILHS
ncbi:MAG: UDP-2,4-diacetamido-2,4,6-trideoxy-beta-L-altropyranose hydrolase [Phycisphaerales bacterium]|nr:UDP-2,4-diacetamido-2,4,6-trideoxy-beta-L-altropyranose hydrolase [Phycisphaerales bacterium]